jgi:hypothetical protein
MASLGFGLSESPSPSCRPYIRTMYGLFETNGAELQASLKNHPLQEKKRPAISGRPFDNP